MPIEKPGQRFRPLAELLEHYRRRDPAKAALVDVDQNKRISFGELAAVVEAVAMQLAGIGMGKGSRILLLADTSIEKMILWLGIWRIGAVVCPLDLFFIGGAASTVLKTIAPDLVIADGRQYGLDVLREVAAPVLRLAEWEAGATGVCVNDEQLVFGAPAPQAAGQLPSAAGADIACMACTSGTTGVPKIVVYDHLAYWKNGLDSIALLGLQAHDRTLEYRSLGWYSAQILSLMPFLQTGLTLHLARRFSYHNLPDWIEKNRITVCAGVPTVVNMLLNQPIPHAARRFSSLRAMTCSTAPLTTAHWIRFEEMYGVCLLNLYGSSETGWICGNRHDARRMGSVGQAVSRVRLDILSESGATCPPGVAGQMSVSADKLALGYLQGDGSLHAIRGKPFIMRDIAVMDRDGYVRILGRTDDLIIRGGVKISPVEIEEVLLRHPGVLEAAVAAVPDAIHGEQPVCLIVARDAFDEGAILAHCAAHLPREKVPAAAIAIAALPRSPRGKLLRDRLAPIYRDAKQPAPGKRYA